MCILKVYSDFDSFKPFKESVIIPVYSTFEKGDFKYGSSGVRQKDYRISFDVSDKDWDDFNGQVQDAISFLEKYQKELKILFSSNRISDAYLDFPIYSRLTDDIVNQNDHLPRKLVSLAGNISIGIEMSIYSKDAFDRLEKPIEP